MQEIQITRGLLDVRQKSNAGELLAGELFLDYTNKDKSYELYVGVPKEGGGTEAKKIAAEGMLSYIDKITTLPTNPIEGGVYFVDANIQLTSDDDNQEGIDFAEFRKGDFAIWAPKYANDAGSTMYGGWLRIKNSGSTSRDVHFDNRNTNYHTDADTVQEALVNADRNKLQFGGILFSTEESDNAIMTLPGDQNYVFYKSALGDFCKPGYFYTIGTLPDGWTGIQYADKAEGAASNGQGSNVATDIVASTLITLEEGDFLFVSSDEITNTNPLDKTTLKFQKCTGGTHSGKKIYVNGADRHENAGNTWDTEDDAIRTVQDAIDVIYKSKADLNEHGKIPLAELPDTVIGAMEFQGSYIVAEGDTFALPTVANKKVHPNNEAEDALVSGDYWVYSGPNQDISGNADIRSAEGLLRTSDWLVYEGDGKWSVVDNTSPVTGIWAGGQEIEGDADFIGNSRGTTGIEETTTEVTVDKKLKISAPNAALIGTTGSNGTIYKENGDKTLVASGLSEASGVLSIVETDGIKISGGIEEDATLGVTIKQNAAQDASINLTLPKADGTIATLEDLESSVSGTHFYIPRYGVNAKGNQVLKDSPIEVIEHDATDGTETVIGLRYHSGALTSDLLYTNTTNVVNLMPDFSGRLLNTNSIIDCGEWTTTGITYDNEGGYNKIIAGTNYAGNEGAYATALFAEHSKVAATPSGNGE